MSYANMSYISHYFLHKIRPGSTNKICQEKQTIPFQFGHQLHCRRVEASSTKFCVQISNGCQRVVVLYSQLPPLKTYPCRVLCVVFKHAGWAYLGWGLLKLRSLISPLAKFSILQKYLLYYLHHIHIWQVSPQLSCGNTCQIWTWYLIGNQCFGNGEKSGN